MERRNFIRFVGAGLVSAPVLTLSALSQAGKKTKPLPPAVNGQVLTSETWNALVERVNEISAQVS